VYPDQTLSLSSESCLDTLGVHAEPHWLRRAPVLVRASQYDRRDGCGCLAG
jgi:hypothetical protein